MMAAVIVLLAQEGSSLDDPVSKYPGVPDGDKIISLNCSRCAAALQLRRRPDFWAILARDQTKAWTPAEVLAIAFKHPPYFPAGTSFTTQTQLRCSA